MSGSILINLTESKDKGTGGISMIVATVKFNTLKIMAVVLALGVIAAVAIWPRGTSVIASTDINYTGVSTNEKRVKFLNSFGWQVESNPIEVVEVNIPQTFNAVYNNYNAIQKKQGFDLSGYKGKRVKRWTYKITNYAGVIDEVRANLLIYDDKVIGGDVSTVALNGFMHGLKESSVAQTSSGVTSQNADITAGIFSSISVK